MLQSIKQGCGSKLRASDGEIGHVKDFYFDDQTWAVRYLVVDTGSWLPGRQVLLSPHSLGRFNQTEKLLLVNLTRRQIEESPSIESQQPVSRQYEYGWPYFWQGDGLRGVSGFPILELPTKRLPGEPGAADDSHSKRTDAQLQSAQAVNGYHIQVSDGRLGHVFDFMMDAQSWEIRQLSIKTGHHFSSEELRVPTNQVDRISYEESTVFVSLTREAIEQNQAHSMTPVSATR